jgi:putative ABC transport system permease protein
MRLSKSGRRPACGWRTATIPRSLVILAPIDAASLSTDYLSMTGIDTRALDRELKRGSAGAPDVIGRSLNVDGTPCEVIGVLPPSFKFLRTDPAVLLPLQLNRADVRVGDFSYPAVARLKPGVTLEQANADVARMIPLAFDRFAMWPGLSRKTFEAAGLGPNVRPLSQDVIGDVGRVLWILLGTVGFVLLIACANVANLFLVRAEGRQPPRCTRHRDGGGVGMMKERLRSDY